MNPEAGVTGTVLVVAGRTLEVDTGEQVVLDGAPVRLSAAPLAILLALLEQPGHVVARSRLLTRLPSGTAGTEHAVEMAVGRLRAGLGADLVQTVVKRGYRLRVE